MSRHGYTVGRKRNPNTDAAAKHSIHRCEASAAARQQRRGSGGAAAAAGLYCTCTFGIGNSFGPGRRSAAANRTPGAGDGARLRRGGGGYIDFDFDVPKLRRLLIMFYFI